MRTHRISVFCLLAAACGPLEDGTVVLDPAPPQAPRSTPPATTPVTPLEVPPATVEVQTVPRATTSVCPSVTRDGAAPLLSVGGEGTAHIVRADGSTLELELNLPNLETTRIRSHTHAASGFVLVNTQFWYINETFEHRSVMTLFTAQGQPLWTNTTELVQDVRIGDDGVIAYTLGGELAITTPDGVTKTVDDTWSVGRPTQGWLATRRYISGSEWQWGWLSTEDLSFTPFQSATNINEGSVVIQGRVLAGIEQDGRGSVLLTRVAGATISRVHRIPGATGSVRLSSFHPSGWLLLSSGGVEMRAAVTPDGGVQFTVLETPLPAGLRPFDGCLQANWSIDRGGRVMAPLRDDDLAFMYIHDPNTRQWQQIDAGFWDAQGVRTTASDGVFTSDIHTTGNTFCPGDNWTSQPRDDVEKDDHTRLMYLRDGAWVSQISPRGSFLMSPVGQCVVSQTVDNTEGTSTTTLLDLSTGGAGRSLPSGAAASWFARP